MYGPFDAKRINRIRSTNVATTIVWVDDTDKITVEPPANVSCNVWVDGNTLRIEGQAGGGDMVGDLTLQARSVSEPGSLVQVKVPRDQANYISISNVHH
jgi:pectate lyase